MKCCSRLTERATGVLEHPHKPPTTPGADGASWARWGLLSALFAEFHIEKGKQDGR